MNAPAYFEIQVDEIARAMEFYTTVFGWKFTRDPQQEKEYWRIETDGPRGAMMVRPMAKPAVGTGANAFVNSMMVENFDDMTKKILAAGGKVIVEKFVVPGVCWQGYFIDTEGNVFGLFEVDQEAR